MRSKPIALLLLLALSSIAFAQLTRMDTGGIDGNSLSGDKIPILGDLLSCPIKQDPLLWILGVIFYISMILQIVHGSISTARGGGNPMSDLSGVGISAISFYLVKEQKLYCNYFSLIFTLIAVNVIAIKLISSGSSFSGFGGGVWNGLKSLKNSIKRVPGGGNLEKEVDAELAADLAKITKYIKKLEKDAQNKIKAERNRAKAEAKKQKKALHVERGRYGKIKVKLFEDANELDMLSEDLREDITAISEDVREIENFETTLKTNIQNTMHLIVSFIQTHQESEADQFTKYGFGNQALSGEIASIESIEKGCDASFNTVLNGAVRFAKLSALLKATDEVFKTAGDYLKQTEKYERTEEKIEKKETKKEVKDVEEKIK